VNASGYPMYIQLPHAMWAAKAFRDMHEPGDEVSWLQPIIGGYFCHGYGGTAVRDLMMGMAPAFVMHVDVPKYWAIGYLLVYHSPLDCIYDMMSTRYHPLRILTRLGEAVDVAVTLPGAYEKGVTNFPNAMMAGPAAAMLSVYGGSLWRYMYNKGRGQKPKVEWMKPGGPTRRGIVYTIFYHWARKHLGVKESRMFITLFHCTWELLQELFSSFDPFEELFNFVALVIKVISSTLKLNTLRTKKPEDVDGTDPTFAVAKSLR